MLIFFGTFMLLVFNVLVVVFSTIMFHTLPSVWAILFVVFFGASALFFDWKVFKYFYYKLKEKKDK